MRFSLEFLFYRKFPCKLPFAIPTICFWISCPLIKWPSENLKALGNDKGSESLILFYGKPMEFLKESLKGSLEGSLIGSLKGTLKGSLKGSLEGYLE